MKLILGLSVEIDDHDEDPSSILKVVLGLEEFIKGLSQNSTVKILGHKSHTTTESTGMVASQSFEIDINSSQPVDLTDAQVETDASQEQEDAVEDTSEENDIVEPITEPEPQLPQEPIEDDVEEELTESQVQETELPSETTHLNTSQQSEPIDEIVATNDELTEEVSALKEEIFYFPFTLEPQKLYNFGYVVENNKQDFAIFANFYNDFKENIFVGQLRDHLLQKTILISSQAFSITQTKSGSYFGFKIDFKDSSIPSKEFDLSDYQCGAVHDGFAAIVSNNIYTYVTVYNGEFHPYQISAQPEEEIPMITCVAVMDPYVFMVAINSTLIVFNSETLQYDSYSMAGLVSVAVCQTTRKLFLGFSYYFVLEAEINDGIVVTGNRVVACDPLLMDCSKGVLIFGSTDNFSFSMDLSTGKYCPSSKLCLAPVKKLDTSK